MDGVKTDELRAEVRLAAGVREAFQRFTEGFQGWWPPEFSWSGAKGLDRIGIEPRTGGALYEYGPGGLRWDWGRVLVWEPPRRVVFSWQIGPDRVPVPRAEEATEVTAAFDPHPDGSGTLVRVRHRYWERHGAAGTGYREAFAQVWPTALDRLRATHGG
ncbi:SRPBCC domain-containing protein [Streptomyces sp. YIM 98790]|uniref:SRPBCC domain-containing protein n=1 Tax=Streptomyces sp. YIM 98790 TaxID=2689077 RepID=UPI00140AFCA5|nr:SRPBCC domain-containing protein [Streptomyces sp. YIM 98790]